MARERNFFFRVSATGLDDLEKQLKAIGPAGTAAFERLKESSPQFVDAWKRAQEEMARAKKTAEEAAGKGKGLGALSDAAEKLEGQTKRAGRALSDVRGATELLAPVSGEAGEAVGRLVGKVQNLADVFGVAANIIGRNPIGALVTVAGIAATAYLALTDRTESYAAAQEEANAIGERARKLLAETAAAAGSAADAKRDLARADRERAAALAEEGQARLRGLREQLALQGGGATGEFDTGAGAFDEARARERVAALNKAALEAQIALEALDRQAAKTAIDEIAARADKARDALDPLGAATRAFDRDLAALAAGLDKGVVSFEDYAARLAFVRGELAKVRQEFDPAFQALRDLGAGSGDLGADARTPADVARDRIASRQALQALAETYDPAAKRAREFADAQALVNEAVRLNPDLAERGRVALARLSVEYTEAGRALRDLAAANSDAGLADQRNDADLAAAKARVADNERAAKFEAYLDQLDRETEAAKATTGEREIQAKLLEAQREAGRELTDLERDRVANAVATRQAYEEQVKAAEKMARDTERVINRSTDRVVDFAGDTILAAMKGKISSGWEFFKEIGLRAIAQVAAEMIFRPIIAPIVAAGVQAVAGAGFGAALGLGGGGASAGSAGGAGGGGLGTALGAVGLGYQAGSSGGFWNSIFGGDSAASGGTVLAGTSGDALRAFDAAQGASYGATSLDAAANAGSAVSGVGSALAAVAPYLTIAGGLYGAYNAIKNPTPTNVIAGLGGVYAGVSAGMGLAGLGALPLAGPIGIAAAAVGLLGSLFGGGKKGNTVVHADQTRREIVFNEDGSLTDLGGPTGYYGASPGRYDYLADVGKAVRQTIADLGGSAPSFSLIGSYDSIAWPGGRGRVDTRDGRVDIEATTDPQTMGLRALKALLPLSAGIDAVTAAVARNSTAEKLEDFAKDIDWAKGLADSVAAIGDLGQSIERLTATAKSSAMSMVKSLGEIETRADSLGVGDIADQAIAKQIRAWMGNQGPRETPSAVQAMLAQIEGAFAGLGEAGAKYGIGQAEVKAANDNALARLREQYESGIRTILDPAGEALRAFDKSADQMRQDARDLGADLVATEKAIAKRRQEVADQALGGVANGVRAALDAQSFGPNSSLSPEARLAEAQRLFGENVAGVRSGDAYASQHLVGSFETLLSEARSAYGSTAEFSALESFGRSTLQNLGVQQGWAGFVPAIQSQTQALTNATLASTQAIVEELARLRKQLQDVEAELFRARRQAS